MSAPDAASPERLDGGEGAPRQSPLGVLGVGLGLVLIAAAAAGLAFLARPDEVLDPAEILAERFAAVGALPFGLRPVAAERDLERRVVIRLDGERAAESAPSALGDEPPRPTSGQDGSSAEEPHTSRIDWDALPVLREGAPPARAALVWYPRERAERVLRELFTSLRFESGGGPGGGGPGGGGSGRGGPPGRHGGSGGRPGDDEPEAPDPKLQDAGNVAWAGYDAPFVRLREFELEDGRATFRESVRVNLTVGPWCCVLFLRWPDGELGSRERTLEVLAALEPVE